MQCAAGTHVFQALFKIFYAVSDVPSVCFKLGFSRSARTDSAAEAGKSRAFAFETGVDVFQLRKFNLNFSFARHRVQCKYIEYQGRPVNYFSVVEGGRDIEGL